MHRATWLGGFLGAAAGWTLAGRNRARVPAPSPSGGAQHPPKPPRAAEPWTAEQRDPALAREERVMPDAEHAAVPAPDPATKTTSQPELASSVARQVQLDESQGLPAPGRSYPGAR